jgi:serine/threonine protein kinase/tetratricopeptide (TPR) repeat protein
MNPETQHQHVLEIVVEQFTSELRAGQQPAVQDYQQRYPQLAQELGSLLSSIAMIEHLKEGSQTRSLPNSRLDQVQQLSHVGNYNILREIGRGGMGIVFAAVHESLGSRVAIKVLPTPPMTGAAHIERFRREAQAAARLHHTNIVSVFGVGQEEGFHYYVMDYVDGHGLNHVISLMRSRELNDASQAEAGQAKRSVLTKTVGSTPTLTSTAVRLQMATSTDRAQPPFKGSMDGLPQGTARFRWCAQLGVRLADALEHAHGANILHRDIKPSNIMLDQQGTVWITDFGLAKDSLSDSQLTKTGEVVGTPQYLPPEALDGQYDQRSEVYALGLVLYELATLRPAYTPGTAAELIRAISKGSPPPIRRCTPNLPLDLATIIDKAVAREPGARYQSAAQLKHDLRAFVEHRPISARRPGTLESTWRWARRNPLVAGLTTMSIGLLALVAVSASVGYWMTTSALKKEAEVTATLREQQKKTDAARQQAEQNLKEMQQQYARAESNVAVTIAAFDEMFKQIIARGGERSVDMQYDSLREISGIESSLTKQDADFLDHMLKFYQQFAELNQDNEKLQVESARAYRRVGNIYQIVGQIPSAIEAYNNSLRLLPEIQGKQDSQPDAIDKQTLLARVQTQNELSAALRRSGSFKESQEWNQRSIGMLEQSGSLTDDPQVRLELARTMSWLGFNMLQALSGAAPQFPDRMGLPDRMGPPDRMGRSGRPGPPEPLGPPPEGRPPGGRPQNGRPPGGRPNDRRPPDLVRMERENLPLNERAIKILDELIAQDPENAEYLATRATCCCTLAAFHLNKQKEKAIEYRNQAVDALDRLTEQRPDSLEYQYLLALASGLMPTEMQADDVKLLERGCQICQQLIERQPTMLDYHHLLANLKIKLAGHYLKQSEPQAAYEQLRSARASMIHLRENAESDRSYRLTFGLFVRELQQLQRLSREESENRIANETGQILQQFRDQERPARPGL